MLKAGLLPSHLRNSRLGAKWTRENRRASTNEWKFCVRKSKMDKERTKNQSNKKIEESSKKINEVVNRKIVMNKKMTK